ncbi:MAG: hypothetical protein KBD78_12580 [Oligoflexales bacterium]|nr:hypothetical protein [Oligoflexales bacterium]
MRLVFSIIIVVTFSILWALSWKVAEVEIDLANRFLLPSLSHPLGSDSLGRDLLSLIQLAIKDSVFPIWLAIIAAFFAAIFAAIFSIVFFNERLSENKLYLSSVFFASAFPVLVLVFVLGIIREKIDGLNVCLSLATIVFFQVYLSVLQHYQKSKKLGFWISDRAIGGKSTRRILKMGILQDWREALTAQLLFCLSAGISIETSLSYIGFGFQDPYVSIGAILSAHFVQALQGNIHIILVSLCSIGLVISFPYSVLNIFKKFRSDSI